MFPCGRSKTPDARDLGSTFRSPPVEPVTPVRDQLLEVREVRAVVPVRLGISSGKRVRANRRFRSVSTASGTWILKERSPVGPPDGCPTLLSESRRQAARRRIRAARA